jgi:hypothetical protein
MSSWRLYPSAFVSVRVCPRPRSPPRLSDSVVCVLGPCKHEKCMCVLFRRPEERISGGLACESFRDLKFIARRQGGRNRLVCLFIVRLGKGSTRCWELRLWDLAHVPFSGQD